MTNVENAVLRVTTYGDAYGAKPAMTRGVVPVRMSA